MTERGDDGWRVVGERFRALGEELRRHYRETEEEPRPSGGLQEALDALVEAADRLATSTGEAIRDPAVRQSGREAFGALAEALEATFGELGSKVRRPGSGERGDAGPEGEDPS